MVWQPQVDEDVSHVGMGRIREGSMETQHARRDRRRDTTLAKFILARKSEILALWEGAVRRLPAARELPKPLLFDSVPQLLEAIARVTEQQPGADSELPADLVEEHAFQRLDSGFDLGRVVTEYSLLRDAILELGEHDSTPVAEPGAVRILHRAIDRAISLSIDRFAGAQSRAAGALDRIANANLESRDLDDLLRRLLAVVIETMPAVDTAAILLREHDILRVRAAVGLEREVELGFTIGIGEGFAGKIAAERRPVFLKSAATDPLVKSHLLRERGVHALYGVPLIEGDTIIGVAHIGSLTAHDFSEDDRRLVGTLASRATTAIYQQMLRARAETAEVGQRFLSDATAILTSSLEYEGTLERICALAVPQLADWCAIDLLGPDGQLRTVGLTHCDPHKLESARRLAERYPLRPDAPFGAPEVIMTGKPQFMPEIPDELLATFARDGEHLRILRELGLSSYIAVPVSAHDRVFGGLSLAMGRTSGRRYGPAQLAIAEHLGRRAGLAIENARLYREAQEAARLREQVLAIVSHDLRNPLGTARLAADVVMKRAEEQGETRIVKAAQTIQRAAVRMERLIDDLLDMASIQVGKLSIQSRAYSAAALLQEAAENHEPIANEHGLRFTVEPYVSELQVRCDRERVLQVFSNLLGNAFKFCRPGDRVALRAQRDGDDIRFTVADTGPGIPPDERQHIFEPFWSAERHAKKGTGLGLFITRGVIEAHGGKIWLASESGRGTAFFFTLPVAQGV
jgi:signal transduction histidine kinase/putative methionine-R-sulfoxide reductase with GAF domain